MRDTVQPVQNYTGPRSWSAARIHAAQSDAGQGVFVAIVSVDAATGQRLAGACYIINNGSLEGCDENGDGQVDFRGAIPGTYTVTETRAPDGYSATADFEAIIPPGTPTTFTVDHRTMETPSDSASSTGQAPDPIFLPGPLTVDSDADLRCQEFAQAWQSIAGLPAMTPEGITAFSGCWQDTSGRWFLPTGTDDPRLPADSILDAVQHEQTASLRVQIEDQLAALHSTMDAIPFDVLVAVPDESLWDGVYMLYNPVKRPGAGYTNPEVAGTPFEGFVTDDYVAVFLPYVQSPDNAALQRYITWWSQRRQASYPTAAVAQLDAMSQQARRRQLQPDRIPWPWELADPFTLETYLLGTIDNGNASAATS